MIFLRSLCELLFKFLEWFRVRAIGGAGPGPWSDPATKMVP
ncbi:MAG: hypothetical protein JWO95_857 [Verrucomicrobiales bacterium]|nr:hypothetical protein [Verrucomicrobiales bacterium]